VSNLTFILKTVEKIVAEQIVRYLRANSLFPCLQLAYRRHHSTETALLRVLSDIFAAAAASRPARPDRRLRLCRPRHSQTTSVTVLRHYRWSTGMSRTISNRPHATSILRRSNIGCLPADLRCTPGLTQFSGHCCSCCIPMKFTPSSQLPVGHLYADVTQVYISAPASSSSATVQQFITCAERLDAWLRSNRLKMNADKTQLLRLGTRQQLDRLTTTELQLLSARVQISTTVLNLGVCLDVQLSTADYVAALCRSCFFQLRQIRL